MIFGHTVYPGGAPFQLLVDYNSSVLMFTILSWWRREYCESQHLTARFVHSSKLCLLYSIILGVVGTVHWYSRPVLPDTESCDLPHLYRH